MEAMLYPASLRGDKAAEDRTTEMLSVVDELVKLSLFFTMLSGFLFAPDVRMKKPAKFAPDVQ